jgi:hypothetical protein
MVTMAVGTTTMTVIATLIVMNVGAGETGTTGDTTTKTGSGENTNGANKSTGSTNGASMSGANTGVGIGTRGQRIIPAVTFTFSTDAR